MGKGRGREENREVGDEKNFIGEEGWTLTSFETDCQAFCLCKTQLQQSVTVFLEPFVEPPADQVPIILILH